MISMGPSMNDATLNDQRSIETTEFVLWTAATLITGFFVPGLGLILGLVLAFTRFRFVKPRMRWSLVALGAALLVLQIVGLASGASESAQSPVSRVN